MDRQRFDIELLNDKDPFEFDDDWQRFHLAKHGGLDSNDVREVWASDPLFYPAQRFLVKPTVRGFGPGKTGVAPPLARVRITQPTTEQ